MRPLPPKLFHPRYWLTWLSFGLWWSISQLPFSWQMAMGRGLGRLMWHLAKNRRQIAEKNIELCFPDLPASEREMMAKENLESTILALFETGMAWFWPAKRLRRLYSIEGVEHLQAANEQGQGALLLGMHFTTLDIGSAFVAVSHSIDGLYRPHNNAVYDFIQRYGREHNSEGGIAIPREDMRQLVRRMRQGRIVWYAPDQDYGPRRPHVFASFFGIPAATIVAPAQLVRMGRGKIIPYTNFRRKDGKGYEVKIFPPLEGYPENDDLKNATRLNQFIEERVKECPEQYMWVHRRFKTRPPGETGFYERKR